MLEVVIEVPPDLELIGAYMYNFIVPGIRRGRIAKDLDLWLYILGYYCHVFYEVLELIVLSC